MGLRGQNESDILRVVSDGGFTRYNEDHMKVWSEWAQIIFYNLAILGGTAGDNSCPLFGIGVFIFTQNRDLMKILI